MRQALLFFPRLVCAVTCVGLILAATPLLWLLGDSRGSTNEGDEPWTP